MTPDVVLRRLSEVGAGWQDLRALLSAEERAEMARFVRAEDRDRYALARATLRLEAGRALGRSPESVAIVRDTLGKPQLVDAPGLACNVSHSGDLVAVALGRAAEIGVDVEEHRDGFRIERVAESIMTPRERAGLARAADRTGYFFRQWCFKEALVKALGTGLTRDPQRFEILVEPEGSRVRFVGAGEDDVGQGWRLSLLPAPAGYSGALAWRPSILSDNPD